jgi:hypothetical protein
MLTRQLLESEVFPSVEARELVRILPGIDCTYFPEFVEYMWSGEGTIIVGLSWTCTRKTPLLSLSIFNFMLLSSILGESAFCMGNMIGHIMFRTWY